MTNKKQLPAIASDPFLTTILQFLFQIIVAIFGMFFGRPTVTLL